MSPLTLAWRARLRSLPAGDRTEDSSADLERLLTESPAQPGQAIATRITTLLATLGRPVGAMRRPSILLDALEDALAAGGADEAWLALAVITARLPSSSEVRHLVRTTRLDGPIPALSAALRDSGQMGSPVWPEVEVVTGCTLVDLRDTTRNPFTTGIQRVARQTARRWQRDHDVILVGWTDGFTAYRRLSDLECDVVLSGRSPTILPARAPDNRALVPWDCQLLVPELPAERERASRYQALACFSRARTGLVGFDCVPLTASETTDPAAGMSTGFAHYLAAAAQVDRIATISEAAGLEYPGLAGHAGRCRPVRARTSSRAPARGGHRPRRRRPGRGPRPARPSAPCPSCCPWAATSPARTTWPCSTPPRSSGAKGCRSTWSSWAATPGTAPTSKPRSTACSHANRPVQTIVRLPDDLLWAAYRLAYCTVFASLHEGFGLPVAESLASGTPVITSDFGSMRRHRQPGRRPAGRPPRRPVPHRRPAPTAHRPPPAGPPGRRSSHNYPTRTWDDYAAETLGLPRRRQRSLRTRPECERARRRLGTAAWSDAGADASMSPIFQLPAQGDDAALLPILRLARHRSAGRRVRTS